MFADEHMVLAGNDLPPTLQITVQPHCCGVVQRHEAGFSELRLADQQPVGRDIGEPEIQRLGDAQSGCDQKRKQCRVGLPFQRA